jgi:DNA-binding CsgD family transcriptional regulator
MFDADIDVFPIDPRKKVKGGHWHCLRKDSLTSRETEVCELLAKGMRLKDVALKLSISIHTAAGHTRNLYLKLGVHDRGALVRHFAPPNVTAVRDTLTGTMLTTFTKN